jgi:DNA polymerase-3 subunit alpha
MSDGRFIELKELVFAGMKNKFNVVDNLILDRINLELEMIKNSNSVEYYLILEKIIGICNKHDFLRTPARNTSGNSLVNYCLDISKLNPLEYDLSIYRFLNPLFEGSRKPNIDLDISFDKQQDFYNYSKYELQQCGYNIFKVAFQNETISSKVDFEKVVINELNYNVSRFTYIISSNDNIFPFNFYSKDGVDFLLEADLSWLNQRATIYNFDIINNNGINKIKETYCLSKCKTHPYNLSLNLPEVFDLFCNGETEKLFQFDSDGIRHILKTLHPTDIRELSIISALYTPKGLDSLMNLTERKIFGYDDEFKSDNRVTQILSPTYGVIAYQDTFLQLVNTVSGIEMAKADFYRREITKNIDKKARDEFRNNFKTGCFRNSDLSEIETDKLLCYLIDSISYALPMSHVIGYSITAYWGAFLKVHHKNEYDFVHCVR